MMQTRSQRGRIGRMLLAGGVLGMGLAGWASAATLTWRGIGDGVVWSDANNWELDGQTGVRVPENGDALVFPGGVSNRTLYNDLTDLAPASITFNGAAYNLQGNAIYLGGAAVNFNINGSDQGTITLDTILTDDLTVYTINALNPSNNRSSARLNWNGAISGNFSFIKTGPTGEGNDGGRLRFGGTENKTYTGDTIIMAGRLEATATNALPYGPGKGNVIVYAGAVLGINQPGGTPVTINGLYGEGIVEKFSYANKELIIGAGDANGDFSGTFVETLPTTSTGWGRLLLTKTGSGTQILRGGGTLSHKVNINDGTVVVNGNFTHMDFDYDPTGGTGLPEEDRLNNDWTVGETAILRGTGSIQLYDMFWVSGTLAPGDENGNPGTLDISSRRFRFATNSRFEVRLGGREPGDGSGYYSQLNLLWTEPTDPEYLDSNANLVVTFVDGFVPQAGDVFYIMTRADTNAFGTVFGGLPEGATLTVGGVELTITYQANWAGSQAASSLTGGNDVALYIPGLPPLLGDTNNDGVVDLADYNNVVNNLGATGGPNLLGDTNKDGVVDLADYNNVVNNLGATRGASLAVPEPATWLALGLLGLAGWRRRGA